MVGAAIGVYVRGRPDAVARRLLNPVEKESFYRRAKRIAFGAGDFTLDLAITWTRSEAELLPYRSECVLASRAANIEALEVCLEDAARRGYDRTVVLGDIVGYGPDPNAVIDRVRALSPLALVRGRFRYRLLVKAPRAYDLSAYLRDWLAAAPKTKGTLKLEVDVDPQSFF